MPPLAAHICAPDAQVGVAGALVYPSGSGLTRLSLPQRTEQHLPILPSTGVVSHVTRSPDGSRLAVARYFRPAGASFGGSDILITGPDAGTPLSTIAHQQPGDLLVSPTWLPDGGLVFERERIVGGSAGSRLERVAPDGSGRQILIDDALAPTISPDGRMLAFVRRGTTDRLVARPLDGSTETELVNNPDLLGIAFPRFSPDGSWIAFSAIGEPSGGLVPRPHAATLASLLPGTRTASAHGLPWDVWLVRPDGSGLRRVTYFYDDDAAIAWSPDGSWLAVFGGEAIKAVSPDGATTYCLMGSGGYGGLDWVE